jgi:hypothetical protein
MVLRLEDGRKVGVPLVRFRRFANATPNALNNYQLMQQRGEGIHWPTLDEDLSVAGLVRDFAANLTRDFFGAHLRAQTRDRHVSNVRGRRSARERWTTLTARLTSS